MRGHLDRGLGYCSREQTIDERRSRLLGFLGFCDQTGPSRRSPGRLERRICAWTCTGRWRGDYTTAVMDDDATNTIRAMGRSPSRTDLRAPG
jgi:hypothetical protein